MACALWRGAVDGVVEDIEGYSADHYVLAVNGTTERGLSVTNFMSGRFIAS